MLLGSLTEAPVPGLHSQMPRPESENVLDPRGLLEVVSGNLWIYF